MTTRHGIMGFDVSWRTIATIVIVGAIMVLVLGVLFRGNWADIVSGALSAISDQLPFSSIIEFFHRL